MIDSLHTYLLDWWFFIWHVIGIFLTGWVLRDWIGTTLKKDVQTLVDKLAEDPPAP